ncbi:MAG TPA: hypothetical protein VL754_17685 [Verrucomicrobiae bacterium]|jgi:hypothetical protein|nr:hypothetical protein [Verrucomicrobiae bacterium]
MSKLEELARRREMLMIRSDGQRERLADSYGQLTRSLRWASLAKSVVQKIKNNPAGLIAPATLMVGPGKFRRLGKAVSVGWSIFRAVRGRRRR